MAFPFEGSSLLDRGPAAAGGFQSRVRAWRNLPQVLLLPGAWRLAEYDTEDFDGLGEFDTGPLHRFTASVAGYYWLYTHLRLWNHVGAFDMATQMVLNGAITICDIEHHFPLTDYSYLHLGNLYYLNAGDTIHVEIFHNQAGGLTWGGIPEENYFCVHRLS